MFWFSIQRLSLTFLIVGRIQRDITNVHTSSCKVPLILIKYEWNLNVLDIFSKNTQISNFIIIRPADCSPAYLSTQNARTHTKCYAVASPHWLFKFLTNFKFSDFNKEHTSSLKMIWVMIETCWIVFKCFNLNILD